MQIPISEIRADTAVTYSLAVDNRSSGVLSVRAAGMEQLAGFQHNAVMIWLLQTFTVVSNK